MRNKYTLELLNPIIFSSATWSEVCKKLGVKPFTGAQTHVKRAATKLGIDYSHFRKSWNKGKVLGDKHPLSHYLVKDETQTTRNALIKRRLIREGIKSYKCELCNLTEWRGQPVPLELDHINSDHWDNRLENLQIICPNCHAQETIARRGSVGELEDPQGLGPCVLKRRARSSRVAPTKSCQDCGKTVSKAATRCKSCKGKLSPNKINWPTNEYLLSQLQTKSFLTLAKELGVSDNAIRKRLRNHAR